MLDKDEDERPKQRRPRGAVPSTLVETCSVSSLPLYRRPSHSSRVMATLPVPSALNTGWRPCIYLQRSSKHETQEVEARQ